MAIFQAVIDFHPSNRQQKEGAYNRLYVSIKKMKSLFRLAVEDLDTR